MRQVVDAAYLPYVASIGVRPGPLDDDYGDLIRQGQVWVLEDGQRVCAMLVLCPEPEAMLLSNVAVDPACQGRGFGRQLIDFAEARAREAGFALIRLYTNAAMSGNLTLYQRLGYRETHRGVEHGFNRVFMEKALG
ncbi:GNAT family N-acetyltransferase [Pseudomonas sp. 148P]|uniref:GNAT family N-acetyltransferase n=1 Tax=Pseudomonas ulcerans TaxID=3115852 RepID=A0ABU7I1U6_9PSED|nr:MULTISPECIES: GNAT family N-acetyltransferase [unclassified Pseudomonas]MEE1926487.1 GNAT family N-acetyltransferase [Pseudomonas sp. 147P]MEE1937706.1 GNAT family N-acetyltransferase [Pseudomonas sp. 148P]